MVRKIREIRAKPESPPAEPPLTKLVIRASSAYGGESRPMIMGGTAIERSMVSVGSMAIYSVKPVTARRNSTTEETKKKRYTIYAVHVQNAITGRSWVVYRRYSDFYALKEKMTEHFKHYGGLFPRLEELVNELYFPRKHKFRSRKRKIVEHRCQSFLSYLVALHRVVISQPYLLQRDVCEIGLSIFRGFLGSTMVQNPEHTDYSNPKPVLQHRLKPADRSCVSQCGNLQTVMEVEAELEASLSCCSTEESPIDSVLGESMSEVDHSSASSSWPEEEEEADQSLVVDEEEEANGSSSFTSDSSVPTTPQKKKRFIHIRKVFRKRTERYADHNSIGTATFVNKRA